MNNEYNLDKLASIKDDLWTRRAVMTALNAEYQSVREEVNTSKAYFPDSMFIEDILALSKAEAEALRVHPGLLRDLAVQHAALVRIQSRLNVLRAEVAPLAALVANLEKFLGIEQVPVRLVLNARAGQ